VFTAEIGCSSQTQPLSYQPLEEAMKKLVFLLSILALFSSGMAAMIVDSTSTPVWKVSVDDAGQSWLKKDLTVRSIALNKVTNHLMVATRTAGTRVVVLDAARGDSLGQLNMTGVSGGTYALNKVGVTDDGVIYGCNLNTANGFRIYRWANESAVPTVAADTTITGVTRYGDAFAVMGQGVNTKIFISGNNAAAKITLLGTRDGLKFHVEKVLPKNGQCMDIFPEDTNTLWIDGTGLNATRLDGNGEITGTLPTSVIPLGASALAHFGYAGYWYLASTGGNLVPAAGRLVQLEDNLADSRVNVVWKGMGANANTSGAGAVVVQPDSDRVWILTTNNALALYPFGGYASFPLVWRSRADTATWQGTSSMARSLAYSLKTRHLYAATRTGGAWIKVFDPATGALIRDLNTAGMEGGTYPLNMVAASEDGQIFAANLALPGEVFKLYRYEKENATPVLVWQGSVAARTGDVLACTGSGDRVTVFASGMDNDRISTFMPIGETLFARGMDIPLPEANAAGLGIAPVNSDYLFVSAPTQPVRYIRKDGTVVFAFDPSEVSGAAVGFSEIPALDGSTRKFLLLTRGFAPGVQALELFGEDGENLCAYWEKWWAATPLYSRTDNPTAASQVVYDVYSNTLIELATNNGLSAYSFANIMPNAGRLEPDPVFSRDYLDFGRVYAGTTPEQHFSIVNRGKIPFEIYTAAFDGESFSSDLAAPVSIDVNDSITVAVTLAADGAGDLDDALTLVTNKGTYEVQVYALVEELWPLVWRQTPDSTAWLGHADETTSLVYNQASGHLLCVSRSDGNQIKILDPGDGRVIRTLTAAGMAGAAVPLHRAAVSADGQIFACTQAPAGSNLALYYWADETAAPVKLFDAPLPGRAGDALGISGTGKDVVAYASGWDNERIYTFATRDGVTFNRGEDILLPEPGAAGNAINPTDDDRFFVGGIGVPVRYLNRTGAVLHEFDQAEFGGTSCSYFTVETTSGAIRRFISVSTGFAPGTRIAELMGTPGDSLCSRYHLLPVATPAYASAPNLSATAQAAYDRVKNTLVELVTNNGLSAYSFIQVVPDPRSWLILTPIAAARADVNGDFKPDRLGEILTIQGTVTTLNFNTGNSSSYYLQDNQGWGINFYSSKINYKLEPGDQVQITGKIEFYNGLTEITATDTAAVRLLGKGVLPALQELSSSAEMNERTEATLVRLTGYYLATPALWPAAGKNATLKFVRAVDTVLVFIDKETDIDGSPAPQGYWAISGVVDQYTTSVPPRDKYEIRPRSLADLTLMTGVARSREELPASYALRQNYPNPFNPVTTIEFESPAAGEVRLKVYDLLGKEVATVFEGRLEAGFHTFSFDGSRLSSGVYFYRVEAGGYTELKKMTLIK